MLSYMDFKQIVNSEEREDWWDLTDNGLAEVDMEVGVCGWTELIRGCTDKLSLKSVEFLI